VFIINQVTEYAGVSGLFTVYRINPIYESLLSRNHDFYKTFCPGIRTLIDG
jgi:hypothetical protein